MGDAYIMRRGGGIGKAFAAISATYPSGSTCTCTKGSRTLRAKDTSGSFLFLLPETGTWTVSCTDGTKTASKSVTVAENQTSSVTLMYSLMLIADGVAQTVAGSFSHSSISDGALCVNANDSSGYGDTVSSESSNSIARNTYTTLKFTMKGQARDGNGYVNVFFGEASIMAITGGSTVSTYTERTLDVSSIASGKVRIDVIARNGASNICIKDMWLE